MQIDHIRWIDLGFLHAGFDGKSAGRRGSRKCSTWNISANGTALENLAIISKTHQVCYPKFFPDGEKKKDGPMTLCIAAECTHQGERTLVLCRDWQAQKGAVTSDDADKQRDIDEGELGCRILIAGSPTRADHLLMACDPVIREFMRKNRPLDTDIDTDRLLQDLKNAIKLVRRELINHWVATTLNMEFDDFRKSGRNDLLESHYHDIWETIKRYDIGAELLITLFDAENRAVIIRTDGLGEVHWENDYSIIGSGGEIARAFLCQVDYDSDKLTLTECIYEVLRAKFAAERSRQVGNSTTLLVTARGKKDQCWSDKGMKYYDDLLTPYKTPSLKFEDDFLEPYDLESEVSSGSEHGKPVEPGDASDERAGRQSPVSPESGDSAAPGRVPEDGSQQA